MEPQVQYAKTRDGVSIAFSVAGSGPPLVHVRTWTATHVQLDWQQEAPGKIYEALAAHRTLITFDRRGAGLSDRNVSDLTLETLTLDLEAVVDHLGLERFAVMGFAFGMMVSTIYALRHPERVSAIISLNGVMSGSAFRQWPRIRALLAMRDADFDTFVETINGNPRMKEIYRASITPEGHQAFVNASETFDVTDLLSQLNLPVLLLYPDRAAVSYAGAFAREMATRIPGAHLVALPGEPAEAIAERVASALDAFLSDAPPDEESQSPSGTAIILFADIADSTALTERLGDAAFREKARELDEALRRAITSNGGTAIEGKLLGDGVLATFGAAREAIACASAIHAAGSHAGLPVHVGIHAGDVIREKDNVYGGAVNIASRVAGEATAGETLVSGTVRDLARTSAGVSFEDRGERELKGVGEPVRLYEVRWRKET